MKKNTQSFFRGFTLVELIIIMTIIGAFAVVLVSAIRPDQQFKKSNDAKVKSDLSQVQGALDLYYNDHNCYPQPDAFDFGGTFIDGSEVYMQHVPESSTCRQDTNSCYIYQTDPSSCPQWTVLYGKTALPPQSGSACILQSFTSDCTPSDYVDDLSCVTSGNFNCSAIAQSTLGLDVPTPTGALATSVPTGVPTSTTAPTATSTPGPTLTPSPTSAPTTGPTPTLVPGTGFNVAGVIFNDTNGDGIKQGEPNLTLYRPYISLYQGIYQRYRVRADSSGNFSFTGVNSGYYTYRVSGYNVTGPSQVGVGPSRLGEQVGVN